MANKPCLKCRKPFKAEHKFNRICSRCARQNDLVRDIITIRVPSSKYAGICFDRLSRDNHYDHDYDGN